MSAKTFTVELERVGKTATMFRVPFDLGDAFGRARPPVKVTIRGHTCEWIEDAKRLEPRARRIAATVERIAAGKAPA